MATALSARSERFGAPAVTVVLPAALLICSALLVPAGGVNGSAQPTTLLAEAADCAATSVIEVAAAPRRRLPALAPLALVGGTLIDGTGGPPRADALVVVLGERIVAVGRVGEVDLPAGARIVETKSLTILPGLGNGHVHTSYSQSRAAAFARSGVTLLLDLCGPASFALVDEHNLQPTLSRTLAAGLFVTVPGGYPAVPFGATTVVFVRSVEEARAATRSLIDQGADIIKIALESGRPLGSSMPMLSPEQARAVVETAHASSVPVAAHVEFARDLERALDAGVDIVAHMVVDDPSDALLAWGVAQNVTWMTTLEVWDYVSTSSGRGALANLRRVHDLGGSIGLATDFGSYAGMQLGVPLIEMERMQQAGMTPMEIIIAATRNLARACRRDADLGTLEVGKLADILVVGDDPLDDIHALGSARLVLRGGVIIRNEGIVLEPAETGAPGRR